MSDLTARLLAKARRPWQAPEFAALAASDILATPAGAALAALVEAAAALEGWWWNEREAFSDDGDGDEVVRVETALRQGSLTEALHDAVDAAEEAAR